ncbi:MAG TPA: histidine kinase [Flavitalea sp.]|nr:histidine kinase [Flavitalea sp.]
MEDLPTNIGIGTTKPSVNDEKLNDIGFRVILIPFFGIAIPLITGMIDYSSFTLWKTKFGFLYTIGIAFVIWHGNRYLLFTLRSYFDWFNKPIRKIIALLLAVSFYTIPVSALLLTGWYHVFAKGNVQWDTVFTATLIIMICVVFITHVYETVFLVRDSESEMLRNAQLERAKVQAELEALKNQIDPHFIFNSLNTLSHLIEERPSKAKQFNDNLADVYRYILQNKSRDLVFLQEEITFIKDYFSLLKIRFENAVQLNINIAEDLYEKFLIRPISLQVLIENAIKHNEFSDASPLMVTITLAGDELIVRNKINKKILRKASSRIGLENLNERYKLTAEKSIIVHEQPEQFLVRLPVLRIE